LALKCLFAVSPSPVSSGVYAPPHKSRKSPALLAHWRLAHSFLISLPALLFALDRHLKVSVRLSTIRQIGEAATLEFFFPFCVPFSPFLVFLFVRDSAPLCSPLLFVEVSLSRSFEWNSRFCTEPRLSAPLSLFTSRNPCSPFVSYCGQGFVSETPLVRCRDGIFRLSFL